MARYVDTDKLLKSAVSKFKCVPLVGVLSYRNGEECFDGLSFEEFINEHPTADVEPVKSWISVDERLPDKMQEVLAYRGEFRGGMMNVYTHLGNGKWEDDYGYRGNTEHEGITHWMPLPEAPKGE